MAKNAGNRTKKKLSNRAKEKRALQKRRTKRRRISLRKGMRAR